MCNCTNGSQCCICCNAYLIQSIDISTFTQQPCCNIFIAIEGSQMKGALAILRSHAKEGMKFIQNNTGWQYAT
jgi:hypothetical protein